MSSLAGDEPPRPDPTLLPLAGTYHRQGFGDAQVYERRGRLLLSLHYAEEDELLPTGGGLRLAGGTFAGEPVRFEMAGGKAVALEAGYMRFIRR